MLILNKEDGIHFFLFIITSVGLSWNIKFNMIHTDVIII